MNTATAQNQNEISVTSHSEGQKPAWVRDLLTQRYYDEEWGRVPLKEETVFEQICLMIFQLGLTFSTVLKYRIALEEFFSGYSLEKVAGLDDQTLELATDNPHLIRNFYKLKACRDNARALIEHSIDVPDELVTALPQPVEIESVSELPRTYPATDSVCGLLREAGLRYVGPVGICSVAQSTGLIRVHTSH